jgi:hypothetical protein
MEEVAAAEEVAVTGRCDYRHKPALTHLQQKLVHCHGMLRVVVHPFSGGLHLRLFPPLDALEQSPELLHGHPRSVLRALLAAVPLPDRYVY